MSDPRTTTGKVAGQEQLLDLHATLRNEEAVAALPPNVISVGWGRHFLEQTGFSEQQKTALARAVVLNLPAAQEGGLLRMEVAYGQGDKQGKVWQNSPKLVAWAAVRAVNQVDIGVRQDMLDLGVPAKALEK